MINQKTVNIMVLFFIIILGLVSVKQIYAVSQGRKITAEEKVMRLAYEIIETSNANFDLQNEINRLRVKNDNFSFNIKDRVKMKEDLQQKLKNYRVINGLEEISGEGVEIKVSGDMITEEIVDLINGIRNTKPKAIAINNQRIIFKSYFLVKEGKLEFDNKTFDLPFFVQVIGDPKVLENSLVRSGGILDIIKQNSFEKVKFEVEVKNKMTLPAYDGKIVFREAKAVE